MQAEELTAIADELLSLSNRFSRRTGYEAEIREMLLSTSAMIRLSADRSGGASASAPTHNLGREMRRIAAELEATFVRLSHLMRLQQDDPDRAPSNLATLRAAAKLIADAAEAVERVGAPAKGSPGAARDLPSAAANWIAALAIARVEEHGEAALEDVDDVLRLAAGDTRRLKAAGRQIRRSELPEDVRRVALELIEAAQRAASQR